MIWFIALIILLFSPFPFLITIYYKKKGWEIYIYNIKVSPSNKKNKKPKDKKNNSLPLKLLFKKPKYNKLSFILKLDLILVYGFEDPAFTAIMYGVLSSLRATAYQTFNTIFGIKKLKMDIFPKFDDKKLELKIQSIILLNLAKIIYIGIATISTKSRNKFNYVKEVI